MTCANAEINLGLMVIFVCLHITLSDYHHCVDLSEGIAHIDAGRVYSVNNVSKVISQSSFTQYNGFCVMSLLIFVMMIMRICVLYLNIIIKS